ncbi:hypothetical protein CVT24_003205 [Panaeolus cyanescens]|uniref:Uncharacterized protein n=1 Tax=Panaeolus cyanescens TaxID=181874 RepID=A0A409YRA6_9AGAR|nr:hypothetical protein CVT24_003205 [Panaeolus cyanescens]
MRPAVAAFLCLHVSLLFSYVGAVPMPMERPAPKRAPTRKTTSSFANFRAQTLTAPTAGELRKLYQGQTLQQYNCKEISHESPEAVSLLNDFATRKVEAGTSGQVVKPADYKDPPPHQRRVVKRIASDPGDSENEREQ